VSRYQIFELDSKHYPHVVEFYQRLLEDSQNQETSEPYLDGIQLDMQAMIRKLDGIRKDVGAQIWVAESEEKAVGFLSLTIQANPFPSERYPEIGFVEAAYVNPEFRGEGILEQLEEKAASFLKRKNVKTAELYVHHTNHSAKEALEPTWILALSGKETKVL